jgi:hypothetical protein
VRLTRRGHAALYLVALPLAFALGLWGDLWAAMPWSVTP